MLGEWRNMKSLVAEPIGMLNLILGVVIGVLASLAAAYLKPSFDSWLAKFSTTIRNKNTRRKAEWDQEVHRLAADRADRADARSVVHTHFLVAIHLLLIGVYTATFPLLFDLLAPDGVTPIRIVGLGGTLLGAFAFALSVRRLYCGDRILRLLSDAKSMAPPRAQIPTQQHAGHVSSEAAPSSSRDEPTA